MCNMIFSKNSPTTKINMYVIESNWNSILANVSTEWGVMSKMREKSNCGIFHSTTKNTLWNVCDQTNNNDNFLYIIWFSTYTNFHNICAHYLLLITIFESIYGNKCEFSSLTFPTNIIINIAIHCNLNLSIIWNNIPFKLYSLIYEHHMKTQISKYFLFVFCRLVRYKWSWTSSTTIIRLIR